MRPTEIFLNHWKSVKDERINSYTIIENIELLNHTVAHIGILKDNVCIAYGNYIKSLDLPTIDEIRPNFQSEKGFIGCGTPSHFWFYFNENIIIINDHSYIHPFDEVMKDYHEFLERISK